MPRYSSYITEKKHLDITKDVDRLMERYPDRTAWSVYEEIAKKYYVSPFTVRDICNNPLEEETNGKEKKG